MSAERCSSPRTHPAHGTRHQDPSTPHTPVRVTVQPDTSAAQHCLFWARELFVVSTGTHKAPRGTHKGAPESRRALVCPAAMSMEVAGARHPDRILRPVLRAHGRRGPYGHRSLFIRCTSHSDFSVAVSSAGKLAPSGVAAEGLRNRTPARRSGCWAV